ncbi:MAG: ABC transporter permease subunit [Caldilineaceae bacterium]
MNIFFQELRANFKSLLIWSVIVFLFVLVSFSKFSAFAGNPEMLTILDGMPPALLETLNMKAFNLTTVTGFYGVMFAYFSLILTVSAVMWGSDIITKEERNKTVEFALTLPIRRSQLITAKAAVALVNCIGLIFVTWASVLVGAAGYKPDSQFFGYVAISMLALFLMQMVFLSIGIFLGSAMKRYKQANSVAVSILLGTFFLSVVVGLNNSLDFLKFLTPFKYFDPVTLLHESRLDPTFVLISLGIAILCMAGSYVAYAKRDLYI